MVSIRPNPTSSFLCSQSWIFLQIFSDDLILVFNYFLSFRCLSSGLWRWTHYSEILTSMYKTERYYRAQGHNLNNDGLGNLKTYICYALFGTLFYLATVASNFGSQWTTYLFFFICRVSASRREIFPPPSLNVANKNLILTKDYWTKQRGPRITVEWNSGERCLSYLHAKHLHWWVARVLKSNNANTYRYEDICHLSWARKILCVQKLCHDVALITAWTSLLALNVAWLQSYLWRITCCVDLQFGLSVWANLI